VRTATAVLLLSGTLLVAAGCGAGKPPTAAELRLQREDLVAVSHALSSVERPVTSEVTATRLAWPLVANGLSVHPVSNPHSPIAAATASAALVKVPALMQDAEAVALTGPASQLAGLFRSYTGLATRGWQLIGSSTQQIEHGSPAAARFARENVALYIESIYDGHFSLAQIGKKLTAGYKKLGGQTAFGRSLTQAEVDALADAYSEHADRLHPHVGVRLGS
jgi:hypothetical protein